MMIKHKTCSTGLAQICLDVPYKKLDMFYDSKFDLPMLRWIHGALFHQRMVPISPFLASTGRTPALAPMAEF